MKPADTTLPVTDDAMAPTLRPGDLAVLKPLPPSLGEGVYMLQTPGGQLYFRRIRIGQAGLEVVADNPAAGPARPVADLGDHEICSRVTAVYHLTPLA